MRIGWFGALLIGAVFIVAGCKGGSSSIPSVTVSNDAAVQPALQRAGTGGAGTIVVVLPTIVAPKPLPTPGGPSNPYFLSSGTQSVSGSFGKTTFGPIDVSAGSSNCKDVAGGRSCTIKAPVQAGINSLKLTTYGAKPSFGRLAFVPSTRIKVLPDVMNYVKPLKWFGVATGVKITASRTKLTQFEPTQIILTVTGVDGSGARIPETNVIGAPGGGFSTQTTATGPYNQSLSVVTFRPTAWNYDGRSKGNETFTATGIINKKPVGTDSVKVKIGPGNASSTGQVIAATVPYAGGNRSIVEFTSSAVGNVAPLRTLNASSRPYGASADGNFWLDQEGGGRQVDTLGDVLGTIAAPGRGIYASANTVDASANEYAAYYPSNDSLCLSKLHIYVFAAGSFGKTTLRNIIGGTSCPASELAVDGTGVLYAYVPPGYNGPNTGTVVEFAPNTTGNVPPSLTISNIFLQNLVGDATGNLYAIQYASESAVSGAGTLVKFAPGATTSTTVLPSIGVSAFALDSKGNIYAEIPTSGSTFQIEEFLAGSTTPSRIIGGSNTALVIPAGITVLP